MNIITAAFFSGFGSALFQVGTAFPLTDLVMLSLSGSAVKRSAAQTADQLAAQKQTAALAQSMRQLPFP